MELMLTQRDNGTIHVTCDGQASHDFDLLPLLIKTDEQEDALIDDPIAYGKKVYVCLFQPGSSAQLALAEQPGRILLVLDGGELDGVAWEYVYGPYGVSDPNDPDYNANFLVLECRFVRGLPARQRIAPPKIDGGLHVIAVPSDPLDKDITPLGIEEEWRRLCDVMGDVPYNLTLERARPATLERVRQLVANGNGRVIHFMGHGGQWPDGALLCFEKENGSIDLVKAQDFVKKVRGAVFLVTLNACVSAHPGPTSFSNLAAALVRQKTPYALGMRFSIIDGDARIFSRVFYSELASGNSVEEALYQARLTLARDGHDWVVGVPVLYTSLTEPAPGFARDEGTPTIKDVLSTIPLEISTLPAVQGTFQGRITDLQQLGTVLTGDTRPRLTTIHAGGGQGKTSLARQAVERFAFAWPGGIWATSLENLPDRATVAGDLARFLGIATQEIADPKEIERQVLAYLAQRRRTLIVLDNAETLIEAIEAKNAAALDVVDWLKQLSSPHISLLATSRTLFGWPGEQVLELGGLSPQEGADLFLECAPQRTSDIDMKLARELSQKLDGHPLSLRLLAGAFNYDKMTLPALIAAYEERLIAAEDKYQLLDHRHRKLYACIETSVRTLDEDLQRLLSGLWIFHAPFVAQTAVAIFDPDVEESEEKPSLIRQYLHTLWLHGLLTFTEIMTRDGGVEFYYLLPTTRPYVEHDMQQRYGREELLARFGAACYTIVDYAYDELKRSAFAVVLVQQTRNDLERGEAHVADESRARYLCYVGWILYRLGSSLRGIQLLERAAEIVGEAEIPLKLSISNNLALVYRATGRPQEALRLYEEALPLTREVGDRAGEATTLNNLAVVYSATGRPQEALRLYEEALPLRREVGDRAGEAATLNGIAYLYQDLQQHIEAQTAFEQSIELSQLVGNPAYEVAGLVGLSLLLYGYLNHADGAKVYMQQAIAILQATGLPQDAAGQTLEQLQYVLETMQRGATLGGSSVPSTLPTEVIQPIIMNTVAVMTVAQDKRSEWYGLVAENLENAQRHEEDLSNEVEFFEAVLGLMDGRVVELPEGHPYALAVKAIRDGIKRGSVQ